MRCDDKDIIKKLRSFVSIVVPSKIIDGSFLFLIRNPLCKNNNAFRAELILIETKIVLTIVYNNNNNDNNN